MRYAIVIQEAGKKAYNVYSPDIDCCFAAGETREEAVGLFRQAVEQYLEDLRTQGQRPPEATTLVDTIEVA